jgi:excisionase family DNA binding protein
MPPGTIARWTQRPARHWSCHRAGTSDAMFYRRTELRPSGCHLQTFRWPRPRSSHARHKDGSALEVSLMLYSASQGTIVSNAMPSVARLPSTKLADCNLPLARLKIVEYFTGEPYGGVRMPEEILTIREVAEFLKVTERTIYRLAADSQIPAFKVGGSWRFRKAELIHWMGEQTKGGSDPYCRPKIGEN